MKFCGILSSGKNKNDILILFIFAKYSITPLFHYFIISIIHQIIFHYINNKLCIYTLFHILIYDKIFTFVLPWLPIYALQKIGHYSQLKTQNSKRINYFNRDLTTKVKTNITITITSKYQ